MQNNEKVALFDFCETLANFQTADAYVDFVRESLCDKRMRRLEFIQICLKKIKVIQIFEKITRYKYSINKRIKLWQLRGHGEQELQRLAEDYYKKIITPNLIPELLDKLLSLKKQNYSIILVSGGYDLYLCYFADEYSLSGVISTKIEFKKGICTGKFDGKDCINNGKIYYLNRYFTSKPKYSMAFSDSKSDLPFLKWVDEGYVVSCDNHQDWSTKNELKEIIWVKK